MNSNVHPSTTRGRVMRWLLICAGVCLMPLVVLALVAVSYLTLDSDAAALRQQVMRASGNHWKTKVQFSLGQTTLGAVNFGLGLVRDRTMADARLAVAAIERASVGVYERSSLLHNNFGTQLFTDTDRAMQLRGWTRLVGVVDKQETVLIYTPRDGNGEASVEVCLAVIDGKELVVVSARMDAEAVTELVKCETVGSIKNRLGLKTGHSI